MKKEMIQTRNRKMNKKMIIKNDAAEDDWTNNDDWLKSYNLNRALDNDKFEDSRDEGIVDNEANDNEVEEINEGNENTNDTIDVDGHPEIEEDPSNFLQFTLQ